MNPRRKRSSTRRSTIIEKARELFWRKGYDGTSLWDIARACGFKPGNIYNYFQDKEHLLYEVLYEEASGLTEMQNSYDENENPVEQWRWIINLSTDVATGSKRAYGLLFDVELRNLTPPHRKKIIELLDNYERFIGNVIQAGIDAGYFAEVDVKLACYAVVSMVLRTKVWYSPKGRLTSDEIADFIFRFTLEGLLRHEKEHSIR